jgi:acetyltransferase-like isoleucine patch superfamily enzyme
MTEKEKSHAGLLYNPYVPELSAARLLTTGKLHKYNKLHLNKIKKREAVLRTIFGRVGKNPNVHNPFYCTYGTNTTVGDNFFANYNCKFMDSGRITIGDNVFIAPDVSIITEEHSFDVEERINGLEYTHPVTIGDNVWLCAGVLVLPSVTIGKNSIIGAGSVVTKDIPENSLAVGNPCRVIRKI